VRLLIDGLAVYRITRLIVEDSILAGPRNRALAWADVHAPKVSEWASCYWCSGLWVAAGVMIVRRTHPRAWPPVAEALALSAVAGILSERPR